MPAKPNISEISNSVPLNLPMSANTPNKKLLRLPHIFSKVLELPFNSDADVQIEDSPECLRFVARTDYDLGEVRAHIVEVYPELKKVVISKRGSNGSLGSELLLTDEMELDVWRFRLPAEARLELAKAVYGGGKLVVIMPKTVGGSGGGGRGCNERPRGQVGNLVLVH
ncbi:hypothetical protein Ancab_030373 [Ancistrocladus abbreviatus]